MSLGILLSGGMDSIALAYWKNPKIAFTVDYGQLSAAGEIHAAANVCATLGIKHEVITVDCSSLGSGDLAGAPPSHLAPVTEWWPFRNQLLATLAGMRGSALGVTELLFGTVKTDSMHADGTAEFFFRLDSLSSLQEGGIRVTAPAIELTTAELIHVSKIPMSILGWSHSCFVAEYACGSCGGCHKHRRVLEEIKHEEG